MYHHLNIKKLRHRQVCTEAGAFFKYYKENYKNLYIILGIILTPTIAAIMDSPIGSIVVMLDVTPVTIGSNNSAVNIVFPPFIT